jgi:hypothetical protein
MLSATTIQQPVVNTELLPVTRSILRVLLYFKIFNYPIKKEELFQYVCSENKIEVQSALARLIGDGYVSTKDDFIWVLNDGQKIIPDRLAGNEKAEKFLKIAKQQANFLSWFPFIKCICVSGSLSKLYMDDHSDIDYFIIAKERRLWLTKLLMSAIVETLEFLGLEKYFCPNYIITENNLTISDRNVYTAMEIITLIPLYNENEYERFLAANNWIKEYFPHFEKNIVMNTHQLRLNKLNGFFRSKVFTWFDTSIFNFYKRRFAKKIQNRKIVAIENDMVITENHFKLHLSGHRHRILQKHQDNIWEFEEKYGVVL